MVLMDIKLPLLNGYEASAKMKSHMPKLKIIAQTASQISEDLLKNKELFDDYIIKPINQGELIRKIERLLFKIQK